MPEEKCEPTPGPWSTDGEGLRMIVRGADASIVAVRHRLPAAVTEANMRLIAAAPETKRQRDALLVSLKAAMRAVTVMSVTEYHAAEALIAECENGSAD